MSGLMRPEPAGPGIPRHNLGVGEMMAERALNKPQQLPPPPLPIQAAMKVKTHEPPKSDRPDFVLYFHPKCPTCGLILAKMRTISLRNIYLQNVIMLQDRPPWLDGVPILADTHLGMIYRGTDAMIFLDSLIHAAESAAATVVTVATAATAATTEKTVESSPTPDTLTTGVTKKLGTMDSLFTLDDESTIPSATQNTKKFDGDKLQEILKLRQEQSKIIPKA